MQNSVFCADEAATHALAEQLARACPSSLVVYLRGELGAGKTSFCRAFIRALGVTGRVKSPTYTLVEPYDADRHRIYHFDLYRLADPEELEFIGIRDYFGEDCIGLIEWPDRGAGLLATADLDITLAFEDQGRQLTLKALSLKGEQLLQQVGADEP